MEAVSTGTVWIQSLADLDHLARRRLCRCNLRYPGLVALSGAFAANCCRHRFAAHPSRSAPRIRRRCLSLRPSHEHINDSAHPDQQPARTRDHRKKRRRSSTSPCPRTCGPIPHPFFRSRRTSATASNSRRGLPQLLVTDSKPGSVGQPAIRLDNARPSAPADREVIDQVLGEGEVSAQIALAMAGRVSVQESVFAGVWRSARIQWRRDCPRKTT
jgi:hypothetical protein